MAGGTLSKLILNSRFQRAARFLVGTLVMSTVALGTVGYLQLAADDPEFDLDLLSLGHVVAILFVGEAPAGTVPLALSIARLTALLSTAGVAIGVALTLGEQRVHRGIARTFADHHVIVGPLDSIRRYATRAVSSGQSVVHSDEEVKASFRGAAHIPMLPEPELWLRRAGVANAAEISIATGSDATTAAALAIVAAENSSAVITAELRDRTSAIALAIASARASDPVAHRLVDVVCVDESLACRFLDQLGSILELDTVESPPVLIVGDAPLVEFIAVRASRSLAQWFRRTSVNRPLMVLVDLDVTTSQGRSSTRSVVETLERLDDVEVVVAPSLAQAAKLTGERSLAVVSYLDPERSVRAALELAVTLPQPSMMVVTDGVDLPLPPLFAFGEPSAELPADQREVEGLWERLARERFRERAGRAGTAATAESWDSLSRVERLEHALRIRTTALSIENGRYRLVPDLHCAAPVTLLDEATLVSMRAAEFGALAETPDGGRSADDQDLLVDQLRLVGIALADVAAQRRDVLRRRSHSRGQYSVTPPPFDPSNELIEDLARSIHQNYYEAAGASSELPAARPWDELTNDLKALNRHQARDNFSKLAALGYEVVPADELALRTSDQPVSFALDLIEQLARDEHDRWAAQRRMQGYRHGPERVDDGPDRRHPDLVAWEQLTEADRDKDRRPMRRMLEVLEAHGLGVIER